MKDIIEIEGLTFKYNNKLIFDKLNLNIIRNKFTTIIGPNNCGKGILSKILLGIIKADANIKIDNLELNQHNVKNIRNMIGYIPNSIENVMLMDTVLDEILMFNDKIDNNKLENLLKYFEIEDILNVNPKHLSDGQKQLIYIISQIASNPKIIMLNKSLTLLDNLTKEKVLNLLKKICVENKITIINITNDTDEIIYSDYVVVINDGKVLINGLKEEVIDNEKLFKKLNLKIPFMVELYQKLKYYGLINKLELNMDKMVNKLWK